MSLQASLTSLPNEILLLIVLQLRAAELYNLSLLSKRLHKIALPLHLAAYKITNPTKSINLKSSTLRALPALRVSLYIRSTKHLTCTLNPNNLLGSIRGLERFISKLTSSGDVRLDLKHLDVNTGLRSSKETDALTEAMTNLLAAIVGSNCNTLVVQNGSILEAPEKQSRSLLSSRLEYPSVSHPTTRSNFFKKLLTKLGLRKKLRLSAEADVQSDIQSDAQPGIRTDNVHELIPNLSPNLSPNNLQNFNIDSLMLLHPPFSLWTIETIRSSSLSSLSLDQMALTSEIWGSFLKSTDIPSLLELSIRAAELHLSDLLDFLSRHHVTTLALCRGNINIRGAPSPPKIRLLELKSLTATTDYLEYFLQSEEILPALKYVAMDPSTDPRSFDPIEKIFGLLASRTQALNLSITIPSYVGTFTDSLKARSSDPNTIIEDKLKCVSSLEIHRGDHGASYTTFVLSLQSTWSQWFSRFPSLVHVGFALHYMDDQKREQFLPMIRLFADSCPFLRSVQLGPDRRRVATWLKEKS